MWMYANKWYTVDKFDVVHLPVSTFSSLSPLHCCVYVSQQCELHHFVNQRSWTLCVFCGSRCCSVYTQQYSVDRGKVRLRIPEPRSMEYWSDFIFLPSKIARRTLVKTSSNRIKRIQCTCCRIHHPLEDYAYVRRNKVYIVPLELTTMTFQVSLTLSQRVLIEIYMLTWHLLKYFFNLFSKINFTFTVSLEDLERLLSEQVWG